MHKQIKPSAFLVANTKLAHEWSVNRCVPHISSEWLDELLSDPSLGQMNSMAKIRLLLAGLLALDKAPDVTDAGAAAGTRQANQQQAGQRAELQRALQRLQDVVGSEADEWVKVMAAAAGPLDGRLHLQAVMQKSPAVQESVTNLTQLVAASSNQHLTAPLEDAFLRDPPSVLDPESAHFVVRANPRVPPLSAGCAYLQATPPPPSLRTQGHPSTAHAAGRAAGSTAAAAQRLQQSRLQQSSSGLAGRAKSGNLERQHSVVVLQDEGEAADLYKNTHLKHGVAAAVRHEQPPHEKPQRPRAVQQEQLQRQQQYARDHAERQRPKGTRFNIYGHKPAAAAAAPPAAAAAAPSSAQAGRVRQRRVEAEIDDLFDDDGFIDDSEVPHIVAPEGGSRVVRHLTHKVSSRRGGSEEQEGTPDDLLDEMEEDLGAGGDEGGEGGGSQMDEGVGMQEDGEGGEEGVAGSGVEAGGVVGGVGGEASAAKRRRMHVIASDSDDDD